MGHTSNPACHSQRELTETSLSQTMAVGSRDQKILLARTRRRYTTVVCSVRIPCTATTCLRMGGIVCSTGSLRARLGIAGVIYVKMGFSKRMVCEEQRRPKKE